MMASSLPPSAKVHSVKALEERLGASLRDLDKLSIEGNEMGLFSQDVKRSLNSLDHRVSGLLKLRYLLLQAYDLRKGNPRLYERWLKVLSEYGVPSYLVDQFTICYGHDEANVDNCFTENHVSMLTDILASGIVLV